MVLQCLFIALLEYLNTAKEAVGAVSVMAILVNSSNDVTGGCILQDEINSRHKGFTRVKKARLFRGEHLSKVIDSSRVQDTSVLLVMFTKGSLDLIATGSVVKLQPGGDAIASSVGVINEETEKGLFARGVVNPSVTWAVAAITELRRLHVCAKKRGGRA